VAQDATLIPVFNRVYRVIEVLECGDEIGFSEFVSDDDPELVRFAQGSAFEDSQWEMNR